MKIYRSGRGIRRNKKVFIIQKRIRLIFIVIWVDHLITSNPTIHYDEVERLFRRGDYVLTDYKNI